MLKGVVIDSCCGFTFYFSVNVLQTFIVSVCSGNIGDVVCDEEEKKSFPTVKKRSCEVPIELRTNQ